MAAPIEYKVSAATIATAIANLGLWALQTYVFHDDAVPLPVTAAIQVLVPALVVFVAGYFTPHTPRPDLVLDPVDVAARGRHVLDDEPSDIPVSKFAPPTATRYDGKEPRA